jgi:hypothetical protein
VPLVLLRICNIARDLPARTPGIRVNLAHTALRKQKESLVRSRNQEEKGAPFLQDEFTLQQYRIFELPILAFHFFFFLDFRTFIPPGGSYEFNPSSTLLRTRDGDELE